MYGYDIENGKAVINENEAAAVRTLFTGFLDGLSIAKAGEQIPRVTTTVAHMLENLAYLGTPFYPAIIDPGTFRLVQEERLRRFDPRKRGRRKARLAPQPVHNSFKFSSRPDPAASLQQVYAMLEPVAEVQFPDFQITVTTRPREAVPACKRE